MIFFETCNNYVFINPLHQILCYIFWKSKSNLFIITGKKMNVYKKLFNVLIVLVVGLLLRFLLSVILRKELLLLNTLSLLLKLAEN